MTIIIIGVIVLLVYLHKRNKKQNNYYGPDTDTTKNSKRKSFFSSNDNWGWDNTHLHKINPASGLPIMGKGNIDIEGNPYGTSSSDDDNFHSGFDDDF